MKTISKLLTLLACATFSAGAYADGFGSGILQVSNFRLLDQQGQPYRTNATFAVYSASVGAMDGTIGGGNSNTGDRAIDMPRLYQNCISGDCSIAENDFSPWTPPQPQPHLIRADQWMTGALHDTATQPLSMSARGDVALGPVGTTGAWSGAGGGRIVMDFMPDESGPMTFVFDASSFVSLRLDPATGENNAFGNTDLHILIEAVSPLVTVFSWMGEALNPRLEINDQPGALLYDTGWQTYSLTTPQLDNNVTYRMTVSYAGAALLNHIVPIPEPSSGAMLAAGLALLVMGRRRLSA